MVKIVGQTYKSGNITGIETFKNASTPILSGMVCTRDTTDADTIADSSSALAYGITGSREGTQVGVIRTGDRIAVQLTAAETPAIGDAVTYVQATGKVSTAAVAAGIVAINATFASVADDTMVAVDGAGVKTTVRGCLIDMAGGV